MQSQRYEVMQISVTHNSHYINYSHKFHHTNNGYKRISGFRCLNTGLLLFCVLRKRIRFILAVVCLCPQIYFIHNSMRLGNLFWIFTRSAWSTQHVLLDFTDLLSPLSAASINLTFLPWTQQGHWDLTDQSALVHWNFPSAEWKVNPETM